MRRRSRRIGPAGDVVEVLPTVVNPIKFAPLTAAAGLALGDTIRQWDTADNPTDLPEVEEPLPPAAERVFMPAVL